MCVREWEVWHEKRAESLAKSWGDPNKCARGKTPWRGKPHWNLIKKACSLVEGDSILDVGCGFGHIFSLLQHMNYLGIDTSEPMIRRARGYFPLHVDKFQLGDAYDLSSLPEFDTVVAIGLIIHLPNPEELLKQLWSKAKICMIFCAWVGPQRVDKIVEGEKTIFERRYTMEQYDELLSKLDGVGRTEKYPHAHPKENYFFKLWRQERNGESAE